MSRSYRDNPPDGGYGWIIVAVSFVNLMIIAAHFVSFSLLYPAITESLGVQYGVSGWIGSVNQALIFLPGFAYSTLVTRYGCKLSTMLGSILTAVGYILSAFGTNVAVLYVTYGIIAGTGLGLVFLPTFVIVQQYFDKNRALASGISLMGFSVGAVISAPPIQYIITIYGWRGGLLIYGAISLHICALGQLFHPPPKMKCADDIVQNMHDSNETQPILPEGRCADNNYSTDKKEQHITISSEENKSIFTDILDFSLLREINFLLFGFGTFCFNIAVLTLNMHLPSRALSFGIPPNYVSFLPVILAIGGIISRLIFSPIANLSCTDRKLVYAVGMFYYSLCVISLSLAFSVGTIAIGCFLAGIGEGATFTVQGTVLVELFGLHRIAKSQAMLNTFTGAAALIATPFSGFLYDTTQNYNIPYVVSGMICTLGSLAIILILIRVCGFTK